MPNIQHTIVQNVKFLLKKIRQISSIPKQEKVAHKLEAYIVDFQRGEIPHYGTVAKKPELVGKKIIWQYWHQGVSEQTSKIVAACLTSVQQHKGECEVIVLNKNTVWDYITLPDFVFEKLDKNGFRLAELSNLIRLNLLSAYGGVWLDATMYLTAPIPEVLLKSDFFAFQRTNTLPPDAAMFLKFDPLYFSWNPRFLAAMLNAFMVAVPHHKIVDDLLSILLEYWKREEKIGQYYLFQICFNRMMQHKEWRELNCEITGDTDCHRLQIVAMQPFNKKLFDEITAQSTIHKLTYRFDKLNQIPEGSFFDYIANEKIEME
ncbi:MAG: capsular polysaccharide synthesis protein [Bacteroidales bacterium]|jgi:hypothetical protein|nr:capsular polysaccharide synthesis protein [Bacteroidales bacterium]